MLQQIGGMSAASAAPARAFDGLEDVQALLQRLAARDEGALRELHARLGRRIVAFALHRTGDLDLAQSVMVDTLMEVWKHPLKFRGESRFSTWILGIARYKLLTALRGREPPVEDIADHSDTLESNEPEPPVRVERLQEREQIRSCLALLSNVQSECLHLLFFEGLTVQEISAIQNVPQGTVKTRLMHGRRQVKLCLERGGWQ
jgi:RNA polymerase sigma-70 factor, ECF subfamily